ncbi:MAG: hypothetical protein JRN44_03010 [Nitrososphaerota archaeon]|jgi:transcription initiation factor TFIIIB Brf1 subunit/transcription initiation factor TFIIB|nr:hypothetical protein [Nitrososphaerota archaeon]
MERQLLGTDIERCRECRGHVVQAGEEFVCMSCGVVARKVEEEKFHVEIHIRAPSQHSNGLGSFIGDKSDKDSSADFNGICTVGFAKLLSDNMGVDQAAWKCKSMIRRVSDRLSIPASIRDDAMALSEKMLAASRDGRPRRRRTSLAAISAYALLSASRGARMDRVGSKDILRAYADMGHNVSRSALLRMGLDSEVPLRPADPAALLRTVMGGLESNARVGKRLARGSIEPGPFFRRLLQASQAIVSAVRPMEEGRNPRTIAAGCVYIASREGDSRPLTQKDVAETVGIAEYTIREFVASVTQKVSRPLSAGEP